MKRKLYIFKDGYRSVSTGEGNAYFSSNIVQPEEELDLTQTSDDEFKAIRKNPYDNKMIEKIKSRIDKAKRINPH